MNYPDGANMDKVLNEIELDEVGFVLNEQGSEFDNVSDAIEYAKAHLAVISSDEIDDVIAEDVMVKLENGELERVATVTFNRLTYKWEVK